MSVRFSNEEEGLINTVELALDWQLPITDQMLEEYRRLIDKRHRLEEARRQQSERNMQEVSGDCQGQQLGEGNDSNLNSGRR